MPDPAAPPGQQATDDEGPRCSMMQSGSCGTSGAPPCPPPLQPRWGVQGGGTSPCGRPGLALPARWGELTSRHLCRDGGIKSVQPLMPKLRPGSCAPPPAQAAAASPAPAPTPAAPPLAAKHKAAAAPSAAAPPASVPPEKRQAARNQRQPAAASAPALPLAPASWAAAIRQGL